LRTRKAHRAFITVVCLFILTSASLASEIETIKRVTALTLEGMKYAYNFQLDSADSKFNQASTLEPTHPRPYVARTTILFWRFALGNDDKLYDQLIVQVEQATDLAEKYQDTHENDADILTCLGSLYGYKAFAEARQKSYLKAAWDGKKSLDFFYDAIQLDPKNYDAYLGIGCYHYFGAFAPKSLQWVISMLGIEGNATLGVKELKLAREKGTFSPVEAQYYLAQFLPWQTGSFEYSDSLLVDLNKRFPENPLIAFTLAIWKMRSNNVTLAKDLLHEITQYDRGSVPGLKAIALYKLAECNFRLNKYEKYIEEYKLFLSMFNDDHYRATAQFRIGVGYEMTGQREQALKHYQASRNAEHKHGDDAYASRKAELFIKAPISSADSALLCAKNAFKSGNYNNAIQLYMMLDTLRGVSATLRTEAIYSLGEVYVDQKKYAEALPYLQKTLSSNVGEETWLTPWAHYQLGMCHTNIGNKTVAKHEFEQVLKIDDDYDFKNWLTFRTERELERLNK